MDISAELELNETGINDILVPDNYNIVSHEGTLPDQMLKHALTVPNFDKHVGAEFMLAFHAWSSGPDHSGEYDGGYDFLGFIDRKQLRELKPNDKCISL